MYFTIGHMHFLIGVTDLKTLIPVHKDELGVLGTIMAQMSLKEGHGGLVKKEGWGHTKR